MSFLSKVFGRDAEKSHQLPPQTAPPPPPQPADNPPSGSHEPDPFYYDLIRAVESRNYDEIRQLAAQGADLNADGFDDFALLKAASDTNSSSGPETIELLLELGADVNHANEDGETALMAAMGTTIGGPSSANFASATTLIKHGADVNARDENGRTVLLRLAQTGYVGAGNLEILFPAGADVNAVDRDENTALMAFNVLGSLHSVQALIEAGADPSRKNNEGQTALDLARARVQEYGGTDGPMVVQLLESGKVTAPDNGWMISWRADDVDPSDADRQVLLRDLSEQVTAAQTEMRDSVLASGPLPFGGFVVFKDRPDAEKIASILQTTGGPTVRIREVQYDLEVNDWRAKS